MESVATLMEPFLRGRAMKPLHSISPVPVFPVPPAAMPATTQNRRERPPNRQAEIRRQWVAAARTALGLESENPPIRYLWLCNSNGCDEGVAVDDRNLAELGRWAMQLGAARCRRAAEVATARYEESRHHKDARRRVERSLRELRLFLTARERQLKRQRRDTLLGQLARAIDTYRMANPGRTEGEIAAAVEKLLAGLRSGQSAR